ncbi:hypothetical protein [Chelativorans sp. AA-79]|uniref:hypothetical protein n=1 Tax=Chelativorans sp. AA-79 TaxID=3028735 RepID=UPI0023F73513|nr:hypothetical protein [Chelativorans sp. AA-79]WEX11176.1 hypothetical protein PVE73_09700 [Chelativorans sp. AA-79]
MLPSTTFQSGVYDAKDMAEIHSAVEAVCEELGIERADFAGRERVASHVMRSWAMGQRTPLGLVHAGLDGAA